MIYHTDSALIKHIFNNLLVQIMRKYQFTDEELFTLAEAKKIMLNKANTIDNQGKSDD